MLGAFEIDGLARDLLKAAGKEWDKMREYKRKLTKEQYERAQKGDWEGIFSDSEVWGYGVESKSLIYEAETDEYFVKFELGSSCD